MEIVRTVETFAENAKPCECVFFIYSFIVMQIYCSKYFLNYISRVLSDAVSDKNLFSLNSDFDSVIYRHIYVPCTFNLINNIIILILSSTDTATSVAN